MLFLAHISLKSTDMKSFSTVIALASIVPAVMSLTMNTPSSVVQCQPQLLTWTDGASPYYLSVIPGGQPAATPIKSFDTQTGNSLTWTVDIPGGTSVTFSLKDSTGAVAYTDMVTVQRGSDSSCLHNPGSPPAGSPSVQDASVNTANVPTSASASGTSSMSSVAIQTGTIRPTITSASGVTSTRAASVVSASSSATQNVSRTATTSARTAVTSSSGAESSLSGHVYGFVTVGAVGLIGALFL